MGSVDNIDIQEIEERNLPLDTAVDCPQTCISYACVHRTVQPGRSSARRLMDPGESRENYREGEITRRIGKLSHFGGKTTRVTRSQ